MTLKFNSEAELFTARRDILRRCMPHGNLWGWGDEQRRDSISAANADPLPEPTKARLLVLVNPAAGKGRGVAAYERDVAPVLCAKGFCRGEGAKSPSDRRGGSRSSQRGRKDGAIGTGGVFF